MQVAGNDEIVPACNRCAIALPRFIARVLRERVVRDVAIFDSRGAARAQQGQIQERLLRIITLWDWPPAKLLPRSRRQIHGPLRQGRNKQTALCHQAQ